MGIFGALTTAVSGLQAQSFALSNISGNIANSQTTAYKRKDTSFTDLIPDDLPSKQNSGSVLAQSISTNNVQGDIQTASKDTYMAINGDGFFVVSKPTSTSDNKPVFGGSDLYTRRGDFSLDKNGYLVNGAGYYLKALPVDSATGNVTGNVPQVIQLTNNILPARASSSVTYQGNLPAFPGVSGADSTEPGSELFNPVGYVADPRTPATSMIAASASGAVMTTPSNLVGSGVGDGDTLTLSVNGGATKTFTIGTGAGQYNTLDELVQAIASDSDLSSGLTVDNDGNALALNGSNINAKFTIGGSAATALGLTAGTVSPTAGTGAGYVAAKDSDDFLKQSISGQAVTVYDSQGSAVSVQFRWAKVNDAATGGQDTWNLFYQTNPNATGTAPEWTNVGTDFTFNAQGQLTPPTTSVDIPNLTVNNDNLGTLSLNLGKAGLTQYADANGTVSMTALTQDGYPAGTVTRVSINGDGRLTAYYSNGQTADLLDIPLVTFTAPDQLQEQDGGAFAATYGSGQAIPGSTASIAGGSLESSNTDISDEFTKLITTQEAYSANTRIVTTSNSMLQDTLNMIR